MATRSDLDLAHRLADLAGETIRPLFRGDWDKRYAAEQNPDHQFLDFA